MKNKVSNIIFLILVTSIIIFFSLSYLLFPQRLFSEDENRVLQTLPQFNFNKLLDGTYTRQLHNYFSDQIIFRTEMIEIKAITELLMLKNENNGILLGKDEYLIEIHLYNKDNYAYLSKNLNKIEKLMEKFEEEGITANSAIVPRKVDILKDYFPEYYSDSRNKAVWNLINNKHFSLTQALSKAQNQGENVFYKTDHHWTADGAYCAYKCLGNALNYTPYDWEHFEIKTLSSHFHGTTYSKSGFLFINFEEIKAPSVKKGKYRVSIVDTNTEFDALYDESYLNKKDKYSLFLSGNNAHVKIYDTENKTKETLLIVKDSFSHALAPFLCEHFNLELIDPRYYNGSIEEYVKENNIKCVLFLFGLDTLASANIGIR